MQCGEDCGTGYLNGTGGVSNCQAGRLTDGPPRCGAEGFKMAPDVTVCADAMRWRDEPHALQPAYLLNDCIAHGVTTILTARRVRQTARRRPAQQGPRISGD